MVLVKPYYFLFVFYFLLLLTACSDEEVVESHLSPSKYCANELVLFSVGDTVPLMRFDNSIKGDSLIAEFLEKEIGKDICDSLIEYGIVIDTQTILKVTFNKYCSVIRCGPGPFVTILMNNEGVVLFNGEVCSIDSVQKKLLSSYENIGYLSDRIYIKFDAEVKIEDGKQLLTELIKGYQYRTEEKANKKYGLSICDLNKEQLKWLIESCQFKVLYGRIVPPPPPPPKMTCGLWKVNSFEEDVIDEEFDNEECIDVKDAMPNGEEIFRFVEEMPEFPGGIYKLMKCLIKQQLKWLNPCLIGFLGSKEERKLT